MVEVIKVNRDNLIEKKADNGMLRPRRSGTDLQDRCPHPVQFEAKNLGVVK
jgi:hypothetical protein